MSEVNREQSPALVVQLGRLLAGAIPFRAGNINDTYRGVVLTRSGEKTAIIKDLTSKELANEVMSAAIGLLLGLPIPPPVLAWASMSNLAATKGPILDDGRLVFASVDVGQPQVAMLYNGGGGRRVLDRLAQWGDLGRLYGFDALVANVDRHAGNILFSGDREVWLIDHGHCFTGPAWTVRDLELPEVAINSRLNEWLTPLLDYKRREQTANEAAWVEKQVARFNMPEIAASNHMRSLLEGGDLDAVLGFLNGRCPHVPRLAALTLGIDKIV